MPGDLRPMDVDHPLPSMRRGELCRKGATMSTDNLAATAKAMVAPGKGILAADESSGTIEKRFTSIDVESTEDSRRAYRELLFTTDGLGEFVSGVILFDETIRQSTADGTPFSELLTAQGIFPGIKVDKGPVALAGFDGEKITEGLDGLRERLAEYAALGCQVHQVAGGHHDRRGHSDGWLHRCQRRGARPLRCAVAGGRARPDRRARGVDGWRPHDRALLRGDGRDPGCRVRRTAPPRRPARRHAAQAEHGRVGQHLPRAGRREGGRRGHGALPARERARRRARDRLPLRRPERRAGHRPPRRDEPPRAAAVAAQLLLRPGAAGAGAEGVEGRGVQRRLPGARRSTTGPS